MTLLAPGKLSGRVKTPGRTRTFIVPNGGEVAAARAKQFQHAR